MLIICEKCNGKGLDNDLPRKRCVGCGGKGQVEDGNDVGFVPSEIGLPFQVMATPNEEKFAEVLPVKKKPWYKF